MHRENNKIGVVFSDVQQDYSEPNGSKSTSGSSVLNSAIRSFIDQHAANITCAVVCSSVFEYDEISFASNWRYYHSGQNVEAGETVMLDSNSETRYSVNYEPVVYKYFRKKALSLDKLVSGPMKLVPRCFERHSSGSMLDGGVHQSLLQCKKAKYVYVDHNMEDTLVDSHTAQDYEALTDVYVVGYVSTSPLKFVPWLLAYVYLCFVQEGINVWLLEDLMHGKFVCKKLNLNWTHSHEMFNRCFDVVGVPPHIQPAQNIKDVGKGKAVVHAAMIWKNSLESMQVIASNLHHIRRIKQDNDPVFVAVTANGVPCAPSDCEYISGDQLKVSRGDPVSRSHYNANLRSTRQSLSTFGHGIPPIENPFGRHLMKGRGVLPFFGAMHMFVTMFVVKVGGVKRFRFGYDDKVFKNVPDMASYSLERCCASAFGVKDGEITAAILKQAPSSRFSVLYQGYLPHHENTLHAWRECIVVCVEIDHMSDANVASQERALYSIESEWVRMWDFARQNVAVSWHNACNPVFNAVIRMNSGDFEVFMHKDLVEFMHSAMHINSGDELANWMMCAPTSAESIVGEWSTYGIGKLSESIIRVLNSQKPLAYDNPDMARLFRAFRISMPSVENGGSVKDLFMERIKEFLIGDKKVDADAIMAAFLRESLVTALSDANGDSKNEIVKSPGNWDGLLFKKGSEKEARRVLADVSDTVELQKLLMKIATFHTSTWLAAMDEVVGRKIVCTLPSWHSRAVWLSGVRYGSIEEPKFSRSVYVLVKE